MKDIVFTAEDHQRVISELVPKIRDLFPEEVLRLPVSEWAEASRTLADGLSPMPGPFSFDVMPHLKEIVDSVSESEPPREVAVMKGTQVGFTVCAIENWIGYTIDSSPAPMLYVTGDGGMAETQMELRIDSMVNNSGIAEKIGSGSKRAGQRKTGDIKTRKEFPGGFLVAAGPNSGPKLRAMSFKKICVDEVDAFPDSTGKEGDPVLLIRRRADAFAETKKILWGSTPLFIHNSKIKKLYEAGDQRRYFVPCKECEHMQYLKWGKKSSPEDQDAESRGGLKFEHDDDDRLIEGSVFYECEECGERWKNSDKDFFLPLGKWRPQAEPRIPGMRSYHVPGLLSPVGFRSWEDGVREFLAIKHEGFQPRQFQNWVNTFLGEPFEDRGERPRLTTLVTRDRGYRRGTLPPEAKPAFVTIGVDVQINRLELEIVAWGRDSVSWSIDYHVLHGDTSDSEDPAWGALRDIIGKRHCGMQALFTGVDAGFRTDVVYDFCDSFKSGVFPVMGTEGLKGYMRTVDIPGRRVPRVNLNTDLLKQEIYRHLSVGLDDEGKPRRGYCHFPVEYDREHFSRLTAEVQVTRTDRAGRIKRVWDAGERRNEQLDCRVYARAMVWGYHHVIEEGMRAEEQIEADENLSWDVFWDMLLRA